MVDIVGHLIIESCEGNNRRKSMRQDTNYFAAWEGMDILELKMLKIARAG